MVGFNDLAEVDLLMEAVYEGGCSGNIADEPLARLLPGIGNQGGFRFYGSPRRGNVSFAVLFSTGRDPDWPDELDPQTGLFTYYGDNKTPGQELHSTGRGGNVLLRDVYDWSHDPSTRVRVPPFFLFQKSALAGRAVRFRGLLAPGGAGLTSDDELQAIWRSTRGQRFQNYRSRFTVLDVARVPRTWIADLMIGNPLGTSCPPPWREWIQARTYVPLLAPSTAVIRGKAEQLPDDLPGKQIIDTVYSHFIDNPHAFEACAVEIWRMLAPATGKCDVTQKSRDGGRDAYGEYLLGPIADHVAVEFALEAKCYRPAVKAVGVREVSRLVSRIRHRQFGVIVTTSYFDRQVYKEVREDGHPIAMICARDIVEVLRSHGYGTVIAVQAWLNNRFPAAT